ncbi:MAG: hypothetical protein LWX83_13850 [Anaerolineae bacterium]|nr:hypothetical protein [Anaerolineae bacterium]
MNRLYQSFFNRRNDRDETTIQGLPWLTSPSIWLYIRKFIDPKTGRLKSDGQILPDEERRTTDIKMKWAAGALDGVFGHHAEANHDPVLAQKISALVVEIANSDDDHAKIELYKLLLRDDLLAYVDLAIKNIIHSDIQPFPLLFQFASFLLHESPDRGPVKFAIALLGVMHAEAEVDAIMLLGCHEEFTLYSAVAISNIFKKPDQYLWQLAQKVEGWGRIHLVERLSRSDNYEIKNWLLREGFRNNIMNEYLAYVCATGGNLKEALSAAEIDDQLLQSTGEIIEALINGGPAEDIEDYDDAQYVINRYLYHLLPRANLLEHYVVVQTINKYLKDGLKNPLERDEKGWDTEQYDLALSYAKKILAYPFWPDRVMEGLSSEKDAPFYLADRVARLIGMNVWEKHYERLVSSLDNSQLWYYVMRDATFTQAEQVVQLALNVLPLDEIATGPADDLSFGSQYVSHACLDKILQGLGDFPGLGWELVRAGLKSPFIHNRNISVRVIERWGQSYWNQDMVRELNQALAIEPVEKVRQLIQQVLGNSSLD